MTYTKARHTTTVYGESPWNVAIIREDGPGYVVHDPRTGADHYVRDGRRAAQKAFWLVNGGNRT